MLAAILMVDMSDIDNKVVSNECRYNWIVFSKNRLISSTITRTKKCCLAVCSITNDSIEENYNWAIYLEM